MLFLKVPCDNQQAPIHLHEMKDHLEAKAQKAMPDGEYLRKLHLLRPREAA